MEGTFAAWVKLDKLGREMTIADRMPLGAAIGWRILVNRAGHVEFCLVGGTGCLASTTQLSAGNWYHVTSVRTATRLQLFINGVREGDGPLRPPISVDGSTLVTVLHLGASQAPGSFLAGSIDEAMLYRRALNPAEIRQLAQASAGT